MAGVYDLENAFKKIEDDLVNEVINGIKKTTPESVLEEGNITVWRSNQLKALQDFKKRNKKYFTKENEKELYKQIEDALTEVYKKAGSAQQKKILDAVGQGLKTKPVGTDEEIFANFNGINDRKLNALMRETEKNLYSAQTSAVRYAEDQYRQIIFNSNVYFNTGAGNLVKCIDMATRNFLEAGINNVQYKNGNRVNIQSYAEMALRTAEKRSYIQGEAKMRDEYGLGLVIVNRRGNACPKCMKFVGKVFNDDVYGDVKPDPRYPLLSEAIAGGLYHPNCKDVHTTYFEGITTEYPAPTAQDLEKAERQYALEQQQRYNERQIRKYKRLADGTLDENEALKYKNKVSQWQARQRQLISNNPTLRRKYNRESVISDIKPSLKTVKPIKEINEFAVELKIDKIPADVRKVQEEQIKNLLNKYGDNRYGTLKIITDGKMSSSDAFYRHGVSKNGLTAQPDLNQIKLSTTSKKSIITDKDGNWKMGITGFNASPEEIIETEKIMVDKKYFTKVDDENILKATLTHEYGHYIERQMAQPFYEKGLLESGLEEYHNFCNGIQDEICNAYKKRTGEDLLKLIGTYGKSNSREFFAEAFKSYELWSECPYKQEIEMILKKYEIL